MAVEKLNPLLTADPVTGGDLHVSELASDESGVTIRGRFEIPRYAKLEPEQAQFLETFLRCRGMLNAVEKELGISYPTVRARLDALLQTLQLAPIKEEAPKKTKAEAQKRRVIDQLEKGEITAEEAKRKLKEAVR